MGIFKKDEFKIKEKEYLKKEKELEKEIDNEYKALVEEEKKTSNMSKKEKIISETKDFIEDMLNDDEFKELESLMSESEKEDLMKTKKEEKRITVISLSIFGGLILIVLISLLTFGYIVQSDLEKITEPLLKEYYKDTFGVSEKIDEIKYLDEDSHIVLAKFKSGINVMCIDNESIGNNSNLDTFYNDYKAYLKTNLNGVKLISNNPKLSYKPYIVDYNYYIDYINTLPSNETFNNMINNNNLILKDIIIYEGVLDYTGIINMINLIGNNSKIELIRMDGANILNLTIIEPNSIKSFDVEEIKYSPDNDSIYLFNQNINKISKVDINTFSESFSSDYKFKYTSIKSIKYSTSYLQGVNSKDDKRDTYYLIKLNKNAKYNNFRMITNRYERLKDLDNPELLTIESSSGLIIVGEQDNLLFANEETVDNSLLCRLKLC